MNCPLLMPLMKEYQVCPLLKIKITLFHLYQHCIFCVMRKDDWYLRIAVAKKGSLNLYHARRCEPVFFTEQAKQARLQIGCHCPWNLELHRDPKQVSLWKHPL
jgi:hypothetical protein